MQDLFHRAADQECLTEGLQRSQDQPYAAQLVLRAALLVDQNEGETLHDSGIHRLLRPSEPAQSTWDS